MAKLHFPKSSPPTESVIEDSMTVLAAAVVGVHDGRLTKIERGDRVHRAIATVLSAWTFGHLKFVANPKCKDK